MDFRFDEIKSDVLVLRSNAATNFVVVDIVFESKLSDLHKVGPDYFHIDLEFCIQK